MCGEQINNFALLRTVTMMLVLKKKTCLTDWFFYHRVMVFVKVFYT